MPSDKKIKIHLPRNSSSKDGQIDATILEPRVGEDQHVLRQVRLIDGYHGHEIVGSHGHPVVGDGLVERCEERSCHLLFSWLPVGGTGSDRLWSQVLSWVTAGGKCHDWEEICRNRKWTHLYWINWLLIIIQSFKWAWFSWSREQKWKTPSCSPMNVNSLVEE